MCIRMWKQCSGEEMVVDIFKNNMTSEADLKEEV